MTTSTGSGNIVFGTSPTLVTPTLGAAAATSINFGGSSLSTYTATTTWTPVFTFATVGNLSVAYTTQNGYYMQIGSVVFANFAIAFTPTFSTSAGNAQITGLPISSHNSSNNVATGSCYTNLFTYTTSTTMCVPEIVSNSSIIILSSSGSGAANGNLTISNFTTGTAYYVVGSIAYLV
jgi:hypothetical protein